MLSALCIIFSFILVLLDNRPECSCFFSMSNSFLDFLFMNVFFSENLTDKSVEKYEFLPLIHNTFLQKINGAFLFLRVACN